jgi:hypothetical protein
MFQLLQGVVTWLKSQRRHGPAASVERRTRLRLEGLEDRLALSGGPLPTGTPLPPPAALVAPSTPGSIVISPERPVHGYKWRPWWPRAENASTGEQAVVVAEMSGKGSVVVSPERPVHGYKWRRPPWWPYAANTSAGEQSPSVAKVAEVPTGLTVTFPEAVHGYKEQAGAGRVKTPFEGKHPELVTEMAAKGPESVVVSPEKKLHGHKGWAKSPQVEKAAAEVVPDHTSGKRQNDVPHEAVAQHLVGGGADERLVLVSANGPGTVLPPTGPAPTDSFTFWYGTLKIGYHEQLTAPAPTEIHSHLRK